MLESLGGRSSRPNYLLLKAPELAEARLIGVAVAGVELRRAAGGCDVALVEDVERHVERGRGRHVAGVAEVTVNRRVSDPVEAFTDVHVDVARGDVVENERG